MNPTLKYIAYRYNVDLTQPSPIWIHELSRGPMACLLRELGFKVGVEVGTLWADHSKVLAENNPEAKLYCIDPYMNSGDYHDYASYQQEPHYEHALVKMDPYNAEIIRKFSMDAVKDFDDNSLDFVYIDGNHDMQNVINDIYEWTKKIKDGGILFGHDYMKSKHRWHSKQVVEAVNAYTGANRINPWFLIGEQGEWDPDPDKHQDGTRSWMWVIQK